MLKLVGTHRDGTIADERILLDSNDRPTFFLLGLAALELTLDVALAIILAKTVFKNKG